MSEPTNEELTVLEIVGQRTSMHTLGVLDQVKQMTALTGSAFDKDVVMGRLNSLKDKGLISYIDKLDSWKITDDGKDHV